MPKPLSLADVGAEAGGGGKPVSSLPSPSPPAESRAPIANAFLAVLIPEKHVWLQKT